MSNDLIDQMRRYLDYAAGESGPESIAQSKSPTPSAGRWYRRGPAIAVIAAVVVLAIGLPALLFGTGSQPPADSELPDPLEVGVDHVWPESGFQGSPEETAAEFARQALGWTDIETTVIPETADGPVWVAVQHPETEDLHTLTIPIGGGRRALAQIGSLGITTGPNEDGEGRWIGVPTVTGAESAILHIRFVDPDRVEVFRANLSDLQQGRFEVATESPIGGVVVVYLDAAGEALTAAGAHFGPLGGGFPPETRAELMGVGCRHETSVETLVATAALENGRAFELWVTRPSEGAAANGTILFEVGDPLAATIGCNPPSEPMPEVWVSTPGEASIEGTLVQVIGHVPETAEVVEVTFDDGTTTRIDVQTGGYFMELIPGPGVDQSPGQPEADLPEVVHFVAIASDGTVVAEEDYR
jgi:hypothetical protein